MIHFLQIPCFYVAWKSITVLQEVLCRCRPEEDESRLHLEVITVLCILILLICFLVSEMVSSFESL
jgi:hypothetical protein